MSALQNREFFDGQYVIVIGITAIKSHWLMTDSNPDERQPSREQVCSVCRAANPLMTSVCLKCGASLSNESVIRTTRTEPLERSARILHYTRQHPDSLLFFVQDEPIPLIVKNTVDMITLGRNDPGATNYHIDLSNHGALMMGVSRVHIRIYRSRQSWMVEDLNSTNGTLLNGIRLVTGLSYMLRTGDQLEAGRMKVQTFFSEVIAADEGIYIMSPAFHHTQPHQDRTPLFTLKDVSVTLSPYLRLIDDLQMQIHQLYQRETEHVGFTSMSLTRSQRVYVSLEGASEAIHLLTEMIMPARVRLRDLTQSDSSELENQIHSLTEACVCYLLRDMPDADPQAHISAYIPIIRAFFTAPFEVALQEQPVT